MINDEGTGHLWVRVDKSNNSTGFFDNMNDRPIRQQEWSTYEIKGVIDAEAANVFFGVFLSGNGELLLDDMSLQLKEGTEWKEVYANTFTDEEQGKTPKSLHINSAVLKEYDVAAKKMESVNQTYISVKSKEVEKSIQDNKHTTLFNQYPKVGEYMHKKIGSGLEVTIPLALYGTKEQTYPAADKIQLERLKEALQQVSASELKGDNLYTRLGDLIIAWNIFQHFYPYFDIAKTDWHQDLKEAITNAYADKTDEDFQGTLQELTAKLKDGHVWVNIVGSKSNFFPPVYWEWVENELVITNVGDTRLPLAKGDIVKKINGRDPKDHFKEVYREISAATDGWLQYRAQTESLKGEKGSELKLEVLTAGNSLKNLSVNRTLNLSQYTSARSTKDSIRLLGKGIYYINIDRTPMDEIDAALPELRNSEVIICDLRGYPKNNHKLIQYLLKEKDTSTQWMQVPQIIYPDQENITGYQKHGWLIKPEATHLNARIIFIIDGRAISYAESFMSFIEHYKLATIVGQPTAGTNGNVNPFSLPGGYTISWTGMKVQKHNGSQHHGVGIRPHVYVEKTIKGIREDKDEFLEKALEIAKKPV